MTPHQEDAFLLYLTNTVRRELLSAPQAIYDAIKDPWEDDDEVKKVPLTETLSVEDDGEADAARVGRLIDSLTTRRDVDEPFGEAYRRALAQYEREAARVCGHNVEQLREILRRIKAHEFPTQRALAAAYRRPSGWAGKVREAVVEQQIMTLDEWGACFSRKRGVRGPDKVRCPTCGAPSRAPSRKVQGADA